jgi:hypothetical protein
LAKQEVSRFYEYNLKHRPDDNISAFQFSLSISKEQNGLVFYSPVLDQERDAELMSALPEFLKESVEFERDDLPIFFYRLSSIIN